MKNQAIFNNYHQSCISLSDCLYSNPSFFHTGKLIFYYTRSLKSSVQNYNSLEKPCPHNSSQMMVEIMTKSKIGEKKFEKNLLDPFPNSYWGDEAIINSLQTIDPQNAFKSDSRVTGLKDQFN